MRLEYELAPELAGHEEFGLIKRQAGYESLLHALADLLVGVRKAPTFWDIVEAELLARESCLDDLAPGDEDLVFEQWAERVKSLKESR